MLNQINIMGRVVRDPELRKTASGISCASARIAVDRDYAGKGKERETDFFDVVAWRKTGEFFAKYFKKGDMVVISGRLQNREWTDNAGNKRVSTEIIANDNGIYFTSPKKSTAATPSTAPSGYTAPSAAPASDFVMLDDDDAQLPF